MNNCHLSLEVLISCMNERDRSIISRSNIQCNAIVVNQCDEEKVDEWSFENVKGDVCHVKMIYTKERGLSRSRNMAIRNATCDICLICDDDELFKNDYPETIIKEFKDNPDYDVIAFNLENPGTEFPLYEEDISYWKAGKLSSWQIAFRRIDKITSIQFNVLMGSGTGNGGGEENKFLIDCLAKGVKIKYVPSLIAKVAQKESLWFHGFDKKYWVNRGWIAKMIFGNIKSIIYIFGQVILRVHDVDKNNSPLKILFWMLKGWCETRK